VDLFAYFVSKVWEGGPIRRKSGHSAEAFGIFAHAYLMW
jgi:hypothetical protein